jgi:hypothetical protein
MEERSRYSPGRASIHSEGPVALRLATTSKRLGTAGIEAHDRRVPLWVLHGPGLGVGVHHLSCAVETAGTTLRIRG